jgi:alkylated DNA repair dioxygenase AlkB
LRRGVGLARSPVIPSLDWLLHFASCHDPMVQPDAGQVWSGRSESKGYMLRPQVVDAEGTVRETPAVPKLFLDIARRAQAEALQQQPGAFEGLPFESEDGFTTIMNYYPPKWGTLMAHSDTSEPSLKAKNGGKRYPVVSMSIGDAAIFTIYPHPDTEGPGIGVDIELRNGDVLLFGGASRLVKHGVGPPLVRTARPAGLKMVPGRLNITLRAL